MGPTVLRFIQFKITFLGLAKLMDFRLQQPAKLGNPLPASPNPALGGLRTLQISDQTSFYNAYNQVEEQRI